MHKAVQRMKEMQQKQDINYELANVIISISVEVQEEGKEREEARISKLNIVKFASSSKDDITGDPLILRPLNFFRRIIKYLS